MRRMQLAHLPSLRDGWIREVCCARGKASTLTGSRSVPEKFPDTLCCRLMPRMCLASPPLG